MLYPATGTTADDETFIARSYWQPIGVGLLILAPLGVAYYADTKWVLAVGIGVMLIMLNEIAARLYDICIRVQRTNLILSSDPRMPSPS
jgi:hypothetical protein